MQAERLRPCLFKAGNSLKRVGQKCQPLRTAPHFWCRSRDSAISFHKDAASKLRKDTEAANNPLQKQECFNMAAAKQETKTNKAGNVGIVPNQMTIDSCAQTGKVICHTMQRSAQGTLIVKTTLRFNKEKLSDAIRTVSSDGQMCHLTWNRAVSPQKLLSFLCLKRLSVFLSLFLLSLLNVSVFPSLRITLLYWGTRQGTALIKRPFSTFQLEHDTPALPPCPKISQHIVFVSRQGCVLVDAHWGTWFSGCYQKENCIYLFLF